jgi:LmbE family N-acetylglucosaminyl deacetylase
LAGSPSRPRRRERGADPGAVLERLRKADAAHSPWRPEWTCYYFINDGIAPSFVVDVSAHYEKKRQALACYASQFVPSGADAVPTRLSAPTFRQLIESATRSSARWRACVGGGNRGPGAGRFGIH